MTCLAHDSIPSYENTDKHTAGAQLLLSNECPQCWEHTASDCQKPVQICQLVRPCEKVTASCQQQACATGAGDVSWSRTGPLGQEDYALCGCYLEAVSLVGGDGEGGWILPSLSRLQPQNAGACGRKGRERPLAPETPFPGPHLSHDTHSPSSCSCLPEG